MERRNVPATLPTGTIRFSTNKTKRVEIQSTHRKLDNIHKDNRRPGEGGQHLGLREQDVGLLPGANGVFRGGLSLSYVKERDDLRRCPG